MQVITHRHQARTADMQSAERVPSSAKCCLLGAITITRLTRWEWSITKL